MPIYLRQSTASQEVPLGYFLDSTDGNTEETGLTIANTDIKIWKTGATTLANKNSGGATHISNGVYYAVLDATDTDTIGPLVIFVHVSGALSIRVECCVLDEAVYDVWFGTTAPSTFAGGAVSSVSGAVGSIASGGITSGSFAAGAINAAAIAADAIGASELAADAVAEIADAIWDEATVGHTTAGTFGEQAKTDIDAILADTGTDGVVVASHTTAAKAEIEAEVDDALGSGTGTALTAIPWNAAWDAEVQSEVDDALVAQNLDHLVKSAVDTNFATTVHLDSVIGQLADNGTSATFDRTTDSLEALQAEHDATQAELANGTYGLSALETLVDDLESRIGTPSNLGSGATVAANLVDIEGQTDDIGVAGAGLTDLGGMSTTMKAQVESEVDDALGSGTGTALTAIPWNAAWDAEVQSEVEDALDVTIADSVPSDGTRPSVRQALLMIARFLMEKSVSGTTVTVKKEDGSTASMTFTLDSGTTPTSITRAS